MSSTVLTVDELATAVGLTVRTTRYYASLGLLPPPERRGRVAYYGAEHRARLELVRALQDHGFTLQAIERVLAGLPEHATVEDLALQRAMLTSWSSQPQERLTRAQLEEVAGRSLSDRDLETLQALGSLERDGGRYVAMPNLPVGVELLDVDIPPGSMEAASEAIRRHMDALAEELTDILREQVLRPYRREAHSAEDAERLEQTVSRLRRLTLEAVVTGFQRAANAVIARSLARD
ncbi:MerR family transcriptional regulator [Nocardioides sp. SOB77]|uniref:MerR family transcriptional regulator n=1 Tax=Nocardioides oceani TaxID=3058369 RepID=A0ABT8FGZ0_9ACTN|nr:MerR family transcriptional regulator [Nocardioides oceani]MDN4173720.1 MerR family transcriptional regulator [Nocardioides oceani]